MPERLRQFSGNKEKEIGTHYTSVSADGKYLRTLIYSGFIAPNQDLIELLLHYASDFDNSPGEDKLFCIGAKTTSILQGRYRRVNKIQPGLFSKTATHFGTRTEHGSGVAGHPAKIQAAIDEVGLTRILIASAVSGAEKAALKARLIKQRRGAFFKIAGKEVEAIDGLVPEGGYHNHVILSPLKPVQTCAFLEAQTGIPNAIVDINYIGGSILAISPSSKYTSEEIYSTLADNPFGQNKQRTPIAIISKIK